MGKRKGDNQFADDDVAPKKHKKHKKKHKHKRSEYDDHDDSPVPEITSPKTSFKLKLKIGGETVSTKKDDCYSVTTIEQASVSSFDDAQDDPIINVTDDVSWDSASVALTPQSSTAAETKTKVNTDDEEEKWLTALEAGTLDDMGEIPKARDPLLLTARQRAMLHGHQVELQQLPSGYKTVELTEEQKQRRLQRAKKRRQQAHEKREKDKKQTMDRLLKKQETKTKGSKLKKRSNVPRVRYMSTAHGVSLSFPQGNLFPITPQVAAPPKAVIMCGVKGCNNPKKYSCSKTQVPLCSLQCYKKNQALSKNSGTLPVVTT